MHVSPAPFAEAYEYGYLGEVHMLRRSVFVALVAGALATTGSISLAPASEAPRQQTSCKANAGCRVFPTVTINYAQPVSAASVQITSGLVSSGDVLFLQYFGGAHIASSYDRATGTLSLTGTATGIEWANILKSVFFRSSAQDGGKRDRLIEAHLGSAKFDGATGHYYELLPSKISWFAARQAAGTRQHLGLTGYLATVTSKGEHAFVARLAGGAPFWLGGQVDNSKNAIWCWTTGPEGLQGGGKGMPFQTRNGAVPGAFTYWAPLHPQNSATATVVAMTSNLQWVSSTPDLAMGYVVEYGGLGTNPSFFDRFSTTVHVADP